MVEGEEINTDNFYEHFWRAFDRPHKKQEQENLGWNKRLSELSWRGLLRKLLGKTDRECWRRVQKQLSNILRDDMEMMKEDK